MYTLIIIVIALSSTVYSQVPINDGLPPGMLDKLQKFSTIYLQKCVKNLDPKQHGNLEKALTEASMCISLHSSPQLSVKDFCSSYGKQFVTCLRKFADAGQGCLDANEKYLPDFILNSQSRVLDKYCKGNSAEHITKIANSKCKKPLSQALNNDFFENCLPNLNVLKNLDKPDYSLNRGDVCSDLKTSQDCIVNSIKNNCEVAKEDTDFLISIFQEYRTDCNFAKINVASFVLLAALFVMSRLFS